MHVLLDKLVLTVVLQVITIVFWILLSILWRMNETFHSLKVYLRQIFQVNISVSDEFNVANALLCVVRYF